MTDKSGLKDGLFSLLKFAIMTSPIVAVVFHFNGDISNPSSSNLASLQLPLLWLVYMLRGFNENLVAATYGSQADAVVFAMVVLRTVQTVNPKPYKLESHSVLLWLIPIAANGCYMFLYATSPSAFAGVKARAGYVKSTTATNTKRSISNGFKLIMSIAIVVWCVTRAALFQFARETPDTMNAVYTILDALFGVFIVVRLDDMQTDPSTEIWPGTGLMVIVFLALTISPVPFQELGMTQLVITLMGALAVMIASVFGNYERNTEGGGVCEVLGTNLFRAMWRLVKNTLNNEHTTQLLYVAGVAFIGYTTMNGDILMTTKVRFHRSVQMIACPIVDVVDGIGLPKKFFEITNDAGVRDALLALNALSLMGNIRNKLRAFITGAYVHILPACVGFTNELVVNKSMTAMISLIPLLFVCTFILTQMFAKSEKLLASPSFWSTALVATALHATFLFLVADIGVSVWAIAPGTYIKRDISTTGRHVIFSEVLMGCVCVLLMFTTGTRRYTSVMEGGGGDWFALSPNPFLSFASSLFTIGKRIGKRLVAESLNPAVILTGTGVFVLVGAVTSVGSPVDYFRIVRTPEYYIRNPSYAAITITDAAGKLSEFATGNLRIALAAANIIVSYLQYVPFIGSAAGAILGLITDFFNLLMSNLMKLPGLADVDIAIGKFNFVNKMHIFNFDLFQSLTIANLPSIDLPDVSLNVPILNIDISANFYGTEFMYIAITVAVLIILAKLLHSTYPVFEIIDSLSTAVLLSGLSFLVVFVVNAVQLMKTYQYSIEFAFKPSAWTYGVACLMFIGAICILITSAVEPENEAMEGDCSDFKVNDRGTRRGGSGKVFRI